MAKLFLIDALRKNNPKSDLFNSDSSVVSYKTGFPTLDYYLGYRVSVYNEDNEIVDTYPSIGIEDGCFITLIGKPSTGKTTVGVQIAANIVRHFENGIVMHFDLEQAQNYSRVMTLTRFKMTDIRDGKYVLKQNRQSIDEIKSAIVQLWKEKISRPDEYTYNVGKKNEFNEDIILYQPTVVIIDSIPMLTVRLNENDKKEMAKLEDLSSQTDQMRQAGEISRFYRDIAPLCKEANIIVISINQIKDKPQVGIVHTPSDIYYLGQNESLPGGRAPQFLANYLIKIVAVGSEKYNKDDDGFDGFGSNFQIIKSRTNQAGQTVPMIYDKVKGFDSLRTSLQFAKDNGIITGNKNGMYFVGDKDNKWIPATVHEDYRANTSLYKTLYDSILPILETKLSAVSPEELNVPDEEFDY